MAPSKASKRTPKSFTKPAAAVTSNSSAIPTPFTTAPAALQPLLPQLDPSKVHLVHVDRHLPSHKKQIFLIPLLLNALVLLALLYRAYFAIPTYINLLKTITGDPSSPTTLNPTTTTNREALLALATRSATLLLDFLLLRFLGPWPLNFFFAQPASPLTWRWHLGGFQAAEVVVRTSRHWGVQELLEGVQEGEQNAFFTSKILPAIERQYVRSKTGYLMQSGVWALDFAAMQDAHTLVERKEFTLADLDRVVLACLPGKHGWVCWRWEVEGDVLEHRRQKVVQFKAALGAMGKESLFWTWAGIVEEERGADGGFDEAGAGKGG
ncbi:hypothetical protein Q7P37_003546 [Cladosporium fusiforme]